MLRQRLNKRTLMVSLAALAVTVTISCLLVWREYRQERLNTALIAAIKRVDVQEVVALLDQGADANTRTGAKQAQSLSKTLARLLAQWRRQPTASPGDAALTLIFNQGVQDEEIIYWPGHAAVREMAQDTIAAALIAHGADPKEPRLYSNYESSLHFAASHGWQRTFQTLVSRGFDGNARDYDGYTPLMCVSADEYAGALLQHGADPNAQAKNGFTPLMQACREGLVESVRLLLVAGADPDARGESGGTPLMQAYNPKIVALLLQHGADPNAHDREGATPLMNIYDCTSVALLLKYGADVNAKDRAGHSVLVYAQINKRIKPATSEQYIHLLTSHGAHK